MNKPDLNKIYYQGSFPYLIIQVPGLGTLCGYIGADFLSPYYKKKHYQCLKGCKGKELDKKYSLSILSYDCTYEKNHPTLENRLEVHGGVTYTGQDELRPKPYWWIGFDCAHYTDLVPGSPFQEGSYKSENFVKEECLKLIYQVSMTTKILVTDLRILVVGLAWFFFLAAILAVIK